MPAANDRANDSKARGDAGPAAATPRPRPLLPAALGLIAGITLSEISGVNAPHAWALAVGVGIVALACLAYGRTRPALGRFALTTAIVVVALAVGFARHQAVVYIPDTHIAHKLEAEPILTRIAGRIVTTPVTTPGEKRNAFLPFNPPARTRFVLAATELRNSQTPVPTTGYVRVGVDGESIEAGLGDAVVVTGWLYRPRGPRNPGETDWARWNRLQGIHAALSTDSADLVRRIDSGGSRAGRLVAALRSGAQSLLFEPFAHVESDESIRLLDAMVLGHRSAAGRKVNEAFLRTGSLHFLAVSGFHVGVLGALTWFIVRRLLRRGPGAASWATIVALTAYATLAEHNAPILRATVMGVSACLAVLSARPFCVVNWLALSAICLLSVNPLQLYRPGFQLSFVQVLLLLTLVPGTYVGVSSTLIQGWRYWLTGEDQTGLPPADADGIMALVWRILWRLTLGLGLVCACGWLFSLPLVLYHFGRFAPWGALLSIVISPLVVITVVLGFLAVALSWLPILGGVIGAALRMATDVLLAAVNGLSQIPGTLVETSAPPAAHVLATYTVVALFLVRRRARQTGSEAPARRGAFGTRSAVLVVSTAFIGFLWLTWLVLPPTGTGKGYRLEVLSVGSGSAALLVAPDRRAALLDVGTIGNFNAGETVGWALRELGVRRLEFAVVSHANFDHFSGLPTLLRKFTVENLVVNPYFEQATRAGSARMLLERLPAAAPPTVARRAGDRLQLGAATIDVLWPPAGLDAGWKANDRSLVLRITIADRRILVPGDIERDAIRALLAEHQAGRIDLRADVLIAPHHGSVISETAAFYATVDPQTVVVSTGRPRPKLRALIAKVLGSDRGVLSTRDAGAVSVWIDAGGRLQVALPHAAGR